MPVHRIEAEMPAVELAEWLAHFKLSAQEQEVERERQKWRNG